ncbi:MSHA biogenesis protein MshK [Shewanella algae]|nr:MSHA biogenesis protein MshK [Shewanella algae]MBO2558394.1 MSHA biogenesis protein MshK [Shewanella algae]MBO2575330.1 MSHA biogenesis protein MshK [Shewanella algae]MBO2605130.1 MSHA biogenesis protein MshK [Shewanella algae]HDS1196650.1 MSHA biogenesis protein MshK [Shewanella algae]
MLLALLCSQDLAAASLRDPTMPAQGVNLPAKEQGGQGLVLSSLLSGPQGKRAVINNQIYRQGDRIQGVVLSRIDQDSVLLADGRRLYLFQAITERKEKH